MKTKLLTACVAAALLAGCGSDGKDPVKQVQAYDGAIWGIPGTYSCADGTSGPIPRTNYDGFANIPGAVDSQVISDPAQCSFSFGLTDAQKADSSFVVTDTSNGKNMKNVSYSVPRGFATAGTKVTASPLTTFIALELGNEPYTPEKAKASLAKLGIDTDALTNDTGVTLEQLLSDTSTAIETLKANPTVAATYSKIVATTHVLSDTLVAKASATKEITTDSLAASVSKTTADLISPEKFPNYPKSKDGTKEVVINLVDDIKTSIDNTGDDGVVPDVTVDETKVDDAVVPPKPVDPTQPPTGTGTGTGSGGGSTGD
ncbi:hypothetical protein ATY37_13725 [Vibrio cidicii]|uniref:Uncharacterized protein n=1 Tax=Vibrio cidicii TaxID=1763883 RepID=A0A151KYU7_9VIBR|nr:hypothetical protein [Vibrio cidicii]KYN88988.1 hypothetical protein ATY37_13725 [Vibrio cidicii]